jgi:hypothetical protein
MSGVLALSAAIAVPVSAQAKAPAPAHGASNGKHGQGGDDGKHGRHGNHGRGDHGHHRPPTYPPGQGIKISKAGQGTDITFVVTDIPDHCQLKVSSRGRDLYPKVKSGSATVAGMFTGRKSGVYDVVATLTGGGCKRAGEQVTTQVVVTKYKVLGPATVRQGEAFDLSATGWLPNLGLTFTITDFGKNTVTIKTKTDSDGRVTEHAALPKAGTYAVVVTQYGGPEKSISVQVLASGHKASH